MCICRIASRSTHRTFVDPNVEQLMGLEPDVFYAELMLLLQRS